MRKVKGISQKEGFVRVETDKTRQFSQRADMRKVAYEQEEEFEDQFPKTSVERSRRLTRDTISAFETLELAPPVTSQQRSRDLPPSPDKLFDFTPDLNGPDPMIAVGYNFILLSQAGSFAFYDKNTLSPVYGPIGTTDFFSSVIDEANLTFGEVAYAPDSVLTDCDGGHDNPTKEISEAYDTRVIYEPVHRRFIILAALRNRLWKGDSSLCSKYAVRIFAFAISITEDPGDGFYMWYWTKKNNRDWPRISADEDVFTVAHNGKGKEGTPTIYVISMEDMINGVSNLRWFTYRRGVGNTPPSVLPEAKYKRNNTAFDNYVYYLRGDGDNAVLYYFKKSASMWTNKPTLHKTDIDLSNEVSFAWHERPVLRNGNIYFTSKVTAEDEDENVHPTIYGFDLYRLPLKKKGNKILFDESSPKKMEYPVYPPSSEERRFVSYEVPSLSVDEQGTILTAFGRLGLTKQGFILPEARYFVFFENENQHRKSKQLKAGEIMPLYLPEGWSIETPDGFINDTKTKGDRHLDYSTVTVDPDQRLVFWIAHAFADSKVGGYSMVVGKVFSP